MPAFSQFLLFQVLNTFIYDYQLVCKVPVYLGSSLFFVLSCQQCHLLREMVVMDSPAASKQGLFLTGLVYVLVYAFFFLSSFCKGKMWIDKTLPPIIIGPTDHRYLS